MRTHLLLLAALAFTCVSLAAPATLDITEVTVAATAQDTCFESTQNTTGQPDPSPCDAVIHNPSTDSWTRAAAHNNKGLIMSAMGMHEDALGDFQTAIELAPGLTEARINRANLLLRLGRYSDALGAYDEALQGATSHQQVALFNRALAHRALGNLEQADRDLAAARRHSDQR
jgi:tetratricopeptide (TPR) repeat protein